jgi:hypothetical protein
LVCQRQWFGIQKRLPGDLAESMLPGKRSFGIIRVHPHLDISLHSLQLLNAYLAVSAKGDSLELVLNRLMKQLPLRTPLRGQSLHHIREIPHRINPVEPC